MHVDLAAGKSVVHGGRDAHSREPCGVCLASSVSQSEKAVIPEEAGNGSGRHFGGR